MISVARLSEQLRDGSARAVDLWSHCASRIQALDGTLGAFLDVDHEGAGAQAEASDARRAQGRALSPLDGVPISVKDNIAVAGRPMTAASRILQGYVPVVDAHVVQRLREAGAVLVGKTNLDEFGMGSSSERSAFRVCRNPWSPARTPGGSSGGAAASVAAGMCAGALGTDTGGSVRQPAAFCGLVGVKPTWGRVSRRGVVAFASSLDQVGVLAHDVDSAALLLGAIAGADPGDATSSARAVPDLQTPVPLSSSTRPFRVGIPRALLHGLGAPMQRALAAIEGHARDAGIDIVEVELPHAPHAVACYYVLCMAEASSNLARSDGVRFGPRAAARDVAALYEQTRALFGDEVKRRILLGSFVLSHGSYEAYVVRAQKVRRRIADDFTHAFSSCDAILMPTTPGPAFALGAHAQDPLSMYLGDLFTLPASLAGLPALSLPAAIVDDEDSDGRVRLPVGVQLIAPAWHEQRLVTLARTLESARGPLPQPTLQEDEP